MTRRWKILIVLGAFLALAAASAFLSMHVKPGNELEAYRKYLRDQGEKLTLAEVLPPMAEPKDNGANIFRDVVAMLSPGPDENCAMALVGPGRAAVGWRQLEVHRPDFTNSWDEFQARVERNRPGIQLLYQILNRPKIDFQLDYAKGDSLPLPDVSAMWRAEPKLEFDALLDLHLANPGAAVTNILTMLALVQKDYREDILVAHLIRLNCLSIALPTTWELLQATNITDAQLASVQNAWQQLDLVGDVARAFAMHRAMMTTDFERWRGSHQGFQELRGFSGPGMRPYPGGSGWDWSSFVEWTRDAIPEIQWRTSRSYSQELEMLHRVQAILTGIRAMQTNNTQFYQADYDLIVTNLDKWGGTNGGGWASFRAAKIPSFEPPDYDTGTLRKTLSVETARHVVITAIALKRFQLKHGQWPASLAELTPEFIPSAPVDPYDGKPLKYHPNDDGTYLLYSVGNDGIDDGGDASPIVAGSFRTLDWQRARDWVWPQPATPAEIQYFREHPPK